MKIKFNKVIQIAIVLFVFGMMLPQLMAQSYLISFAGTGTSTTVDSVKVENFMQGTSLTLSGTDQLLLGTVGVNELNVNNDNLQVYPNPMQGQTELLFYAKQSGNNQLIIYDIAGKEVLQSNKNISQGINKYKLSGLKQGLYFINIIGENYLYTTKLISLNTNQTKANLEYIGIEKRKASINKLKSTTSIICMAYTNGDRLLFKGISGHYSTVVTDIPTSSKTITFNFVSCTDCNNNNYATVQIGTQLWMAENLKTTKYRNCDTIPNVADNTAWNNLTTGAYSNYYNDANTAITYGRLYNYYTTSDTRNLCPTGWHIPADSEWTTLTTYLGGESIAGSKLKETGTANWSSPNTAATNETGFTALPAGYRYGDGTCSLIGDYGFWWSSTEISTTGAWDRGMSYDNSSMGRGNGDKVNGFSVRCVNDSINDVAKPVYDIDGNGYDTVVIGSQTWMKQDLNVTHYRNGDTIPNVTDNTTWINLTFGSYSDYNNSPDSSAIYGRIYNFYTIADPRNLCPSGWHIPSDAEWTTLTDYLGGEGIAGGKLKEAGLSHWNNPNTAATNETGFTALPAGVRGAAFGLCELVGSSGYWWSSVEAGTLIAWYRYMNYGSSNASRVNDDKRNGFSARCLKD